MTGGLSGHDSTVKMTQPITTQDSFNVLLLPTVGSDTEGNTEMTMDEWAAIQWEFPETRFQQLVQKVYGGITVEPLRKPSKEN